MGDDVEQDHRWSEARQFNWTAPRVFQFDTNDFEAAAGYPADGPCERRQATSTATGRATS